MQSDKKDEKARRGEQSSPPAVETWRQLLPSYVICLIIIVLSFATDVVLPRGATAAIGYCLVPVLARAPGHRRILLSLMILCTVLTWVGYLLEPAGALRWVSLFDRTMVTAVLWLTLLLVWRRMEGEVALAQKAEALRKAVGELQRSNTELSEFSTVVSHDIRGPLCSISMAARILSSQTAVKASGECKEWIDSIISEVSAVNDLIERLLSYARLGAARIKLARCDCEAILQSVREALRAELEEAEARITNDPLPTVRADPALMAELFQNLVENSIKYRGLESLQIHVSSESAADGCLFLLRDNGIGMTPETCTHIFDRFYQSEGEGSRPGLGLGLATCKRIVERHGGWIDVQSEPGTGSTFRFLIPSEP